MFLPGLGHVYLGRPKAGVAFLASSLSLGALVATRAHLALLTEWAADLAATAIFLSFASVWVYQLADAMHLVKTRNRSLRPPGTYPG